MTDSTLSFKHLKPKTQQWVQGILDDYDLESHHVRLLVAAAEAWDRAEEARLTIKKDGAYITNRFGDLKPHPGLAVEKDSKILFARLIRELALDIDEPEETKPPQIRGKSHLKYGG